MVLRGSAWASQSPAAGQDVRSGNAEEFAEMSSCAASGLYLSLAYPQRACRSELVR